MISRRSLLGSVAVLAVVPLGACSKAQIDATYNELVTVAQKLESAAKLFVQKTTAAVTAAIAAIQPYIVPCCRLVVSMDTMAQTLVTNGSLKPGSNATLSGALNDLHATATLSLVATTAQSGAAPADPVTLATDLLQLVSTVMAITSNKVTPTAAAATA